MHESTVSRVTTNKYVHTPQGIFELKYFFNSGIARTDGDDLASEAVKIKIKQIIAAREPARARTRTRRSSSCSRTRTSTSRGAPSPSTASNSASCRASNAAKCSSSARDNAASVVRRRETEQNAVRRKLPRWEQDRRGPPKGDLGAYHAALDHVSAHGCLPGGARVRRGQAGEDPKYFTAIRSRPTPCSRSSAASTTSRISNITLPNGLVINAKETTEDMYSSIDLAAARIERQVRKWKEKIRDHKPHGGPLDVGARAGARRPRRSSRRPRAAAARRPRARRRPRPASPRLPGRQGRDASRRAP